NRHEDGDDVALYQESRHPEVEQDWAKNKVVEKGNKSPLLLRFLPGLRPGSEHDCTHDRDQDQNRRDLEGKQELMKKQLRDLPRITWKSADGDFSATRMSQHHPANEN